LTALSKSGSPPSNPKQLGGRLLMNFIFPIYILELLSEFVSVSWQSHHLKDHCATLNPKNPKPLFWQSCRIEQRICCASQYSNKDLSVVQNYANSVESSISCMMPKRSSFKVQKLANPKPFDLYDKTKNLLWHLSSQTRIFLWFKTLPILLNPSFPSWCSNIFPSRCRSL
jgi:hypothetical protein